MDGALTFGLGQGDVWMVVTLVSKSKIGRGKTNLSSNLGLGV